MANLIKSTGHVRAAEDAIAFTAEGALATLDTSTWVIDAKVKLTALTLVTAGGFAGISETLSVYADFAFFAFYAYTKVST